MLGDIFSTIIGDVVGDIVIKGPIGLVAWLLTGRKTKLWEEEIQGHPVRNWTLGFLFWGVMVSLFLVFILPKL
ncbi:MAG: hypothetical protein Q7T01_00605 [bacterium]|nr:hypothetical protein [bacterium]